MLLLSWGVSGPPPYPTALWAPLVGHGAWILYPPRSLLYRPSTECELRTGFLLASPLLVQQQLPGQIRQLKASFLPLMPRALVVAVFPR